MTAGPLSMPNKNKELYNSLDTSEKRDQAGSFVTGKTAQSHKHNAVSTDTLIEQNKGTKLGARLTAWKNSKQCQDNPGAFHRPGSSKK